MDFLMTAESVWELSDALQPHKWKNPGFEWDRGWEHGDLMHALIDRDCSFHPGAEKGPKKMIEWTYVDHGVSTPFSDRFTLDKKVRDAFRRAGCYFFDESTIREMLAKERN